MINYKFITLNLSLTFSINNIANASKINSNILINVVSQQNMINQSINDVQLDPTKLGERNGSVGALF